MFDALWAFSYHGVLPENLQGAIFGHSLKTYGWVYLIVGIILIICGFALVSRSQIARWIGILAGAVACISAVWWMRYYPIWSLTYVALGALYLGFAAYVPSTVGLLVATAIMFAGFFATFSATKDD